MWEWGLTWFRSKKGYLLSDTDNQDSTVRTGPAIFPKLEDRSPENEFEYYDVRSVFEDDSSVAPHHSLYFDIDSDEPNDLIEFANNWGLLGILPRMNTTGLINFLNLEDAYVERYKPGIPECDFLYKDFPAEKFKYVSESLMSIKKRSRAELSSIKKEAKALFCRFFGEKQYYKWLLSQHDIERILLNYREPIDPPVPPSALGRPLWDRPLDFPDAVDQFKDTIQKWCSLECNPPEKGLYDFSVTFGETSYFPEHETTMVVKIDSLLDACYLMALEDVRQGRLDQCKACGKVQKVTDSVIESKKSTHQYALSKLFFCDQLEQYSHKSCYYPMMRRHNDFRDDFEEPLEKNFTETELRKFPISSGGKRAQPYQLVDSEFWKADDIDPSVGPKVKKLAKDFAREKLNDSRVEDDQLLNYLAEIDVE